MKVDFKKNIPEDGVSILLYSRKFFGDQSELFSGQTFGAKRDEKVVLCSGNRTSILVGLGDDTDAPKLERFGWGLLRYIRDNGFRNVSLTLDNGEREDNDVALLSLLAGMGLADYKFDKYLSKAKREEAEEKPLNLTLAVRDEEKAEASYREFSIIRENVFFCRDLVNEPPSVINPESYADICRGLGSLGLEIEILGEEEMRRLGMNLLLSVGKGSTFESKMVLLRWQGLEEFRDPIALVGKGVTFDSGGISLKPGNAMYDMKCDMSGSAVVVSVLRLLAERKAKVNVLGAIGLVENMPSNGATKPGDIVKSLSGQTVEILNTDAEGRLVLADLLYYVATNYRPSVMIDLATLTGAIVVSLGPFRAGLFSNSEDLAREIVGAADATGEHCWRMPLDDPGGEYDKMLDSTIADMKNISTAKHSGSITAAQFLQRFIDKHPKWAHLDIAATAFLDDKKCFFVDAGATGYGVRLINSLIESNYEKHWGRIY
ncbi:MAG: leucyl aminopeptidase [Rickettsiales bacterium]|jgi:leucyl aminopeptidase|nr:leucyl aminopeptidase [Rickettsiales bacterium]